MARSVPASRASELLFCCQDGEIVRESRTSRIVCAMPDRIYVLAEDEVICG